jgi:two-component system, chemotaxis family, sensor kinase Cph1
MEQKKNYDSEFCGSLPLHLINLIQPYGVLVVLNKADFRIIQVSENIETITGLNAQQAINTSIENYISADQFSELIQKFAKDITGKIPLNLTFAVNGIFYSFLALIHSRSEYLILEMEEKETLSRKETFVDVYQEIKFAMAKINLTSTTEEICNTAIVELKRLSGFDKIMVYRFDEDWNGEVIAEIMEEGMESYLGLRFPASDIPKQARDLYLKNPYRLIPTIDYTPVKIYPVINSATNAFIDLGNCNLRSVPAVHLEYLKNMGVMASMSTAIIKDEQLWGLISCHHRSSKFLNYEMCSVFELMAGVISSRVSSIQNKEQMQTSSNAHTILGKLMEQVYIDDNPITAITNHDTSILNLLDAEGAAIIYNRKMNTVGNVPDNYQIKDLVLWLQGRNIEKVTTITNLSAEYEDAGAYTDIGSGVIVLPIHAEKGEFIIGFKPEVVQKVNWGGNPNDAINFEPNKVTYHPRNSFKLWQQTVQHTSLPWEKHFLQVAEGFRNFLIEYTLKKVYSMM